jgi:catechol 2,3-dioxygenase-like lactoylglutathione lyase family enzyme
MPRAIDHVVIPTLDLAAQATLYRRLGFQVGARNRHPWGTENHIVQFDGAFLELIGLGEGFEAPASDPRVFSFARFVAEFLARREGLAMLVLRSNDAEADRCAFAAKGLGNFQRFDFARRAQRPDGASVDVAFSLAFASCAALPQTGFFVCQQHFPENFWSRQAQVHPNGALGVASLTLNHPRPTESVDFLTKFFEAPAHAEAQGYVFELLEGARVELKRAGGDPGIAAMTIRVADLAAAARVLDKKGVAFARRADRLEVAPEVALGAEIAFVAE